MFYSTTFLARKGPLGTVWIAAHLQHKLKKSHYASIRIPETVDEIMCPAVPIALRMSGHLLLGVTRIYAKKVDYLYQDSNHALTSLIKAFSSMEVNLPEDARQAPVHSITLPEKFDLDALELDYDVHSDRFLDDHLRDPEDITLADQIPVERESYIAVRFDEEISPGDLTYHDDVMGVGPMDEDTVPPNESDRNMGFQEVISTPPRPAGHQIWPQPEQGTESSLGVQAPGPDNQSKEPDGRDSDNRSPQTQSVPEFEVMRDASRDSGPEPFNPFLPEYGNILADEQNMNINQDTSGKRIASPILEEIPESGGYSLPFQLQPEPPSSIPSGDAPGTPTTDSLFRHEFPEFVVRSISPIQPARPRRRKRQYYDKTTVLSNNFMKQTLEDCNDLLRKRSKHGGALRPWKQNVGLRKEQVFDEPLTTGLSENLCNVFRKDFIGTKPHLVEKVSAEPSASETIPATDSFQETRSPAPDASALNPEFSIPETHHPAQATERFSELGMEQSPGRLADISPDMELERLRSYQVPSVEDMPSNIVPSPSGRDNRTPVSADLYTGSELNWGTTGTEMMSASDLATSIGTSIGTYGSVSVLETPMTFPEEGSGARTFDLPDIPELNPTDYGDLQFLEADSSPVGSQQGQHFDMLSVRSRAVANYLKSQSPASPSSADSSGLLSLNSILEGKPRKLCARMFYETLVLKSHGLVDVNQDEPYGDISLKLNPELSKGQF